LLAAIDFSTRDFRHALGQFATGVTIVTTADAQGHPVGLTVSSFNSVSLDPPLVLWSMAHRAGSLPIFQQCQHYAIHVLSAEQQVLAQRFATRGIDKFAGVDWQPNAHGVPVIVGAAAVFECDNRSRYDEGDHVIFVGQVARCSHAQGALPLLYHGGHMYAKHGVPAAPYAD
jgi:flavin reductase (DIM6/NTAB) family NADH-FMN oxidoreductase RutF